MQYVVISLKQLGLDNGMTLHYIVCTQTKRGEKKMKLSHADYRATCNEAFTVKISDPSVFWNQTDGFYVAPSAQLVPNTDLCVGLAYYSLTNNSARRLSGSPRGYGAR